MKTVSEPARTTPIVHETDICIVGGSCTGVFAAVRAARMGARVAIVENNGFFGGVATAGLVNIWHALTDTTGQQQVIGGMTAEVIRRLASRNAVFDAGAVREHVLNTEELKIELDELIREAGVRPFLHARFVQPAAADGSVDAIVIEDKSGRRAIRARYFVDATGDGDLVRRMGLPTTTLPDLQPPTACAVIEGLARVETANPGFRLSDAAFDPACPGSLPRGFMWSSRVVGAADMRMVAGTRVSHADCADADQLTAAEMEGRRQVRAILDMLRRHIPHGDEVHLRALPAYLGVRETRHANCLHRITESELLSGYQFPDSIANGTYRVDVHHSDKPGLTLRYLDGREDYVAPGQPTVQGRWREPGDDCATFYQIPYRSLIPVGARNVLVAGRLADADRGAYGATRVMVNCNQTGEAAGTACVLALRRSLNVDQVDPAALRRELEDGGSIILPEP